MAGECRRQLVPELELAGSAGFVGMSDLVFVLLQLVGDEALGADERLLAHIVLGHVLEVRARNFEVVAKDLVVPHLQVADAGPGPLTALQVCEEVVAFGGEPDELV